MHCKTYLIVFLFFSFFFVLDDAWSQGSAPWRLDDVLNPPNWLTLSGEHRSRIESVDSQYRRTRNGGDQALLFRTLLKAQLNFDTLKINTEIQDSRAELVDSGSPLSTSVVNPLELLQANIQFDIDNLFQQGDSSSIRAGRLTMDLGKRRFVARNRFRNTINAFTGVDWQWKGGNNSQIRTFYMLPVQRVVDGSTLENDPAFDKEHSEVAFWGVFYSPSILRWNGQGEIYLFGLNEEDVPGRATRDRDIYTAGFRLYKKPKTNQFDYEIESAYQWGSSRASTSSTIDLDHSAYFTHVEFGYTFDAAMSPQLLFQYDYASGDSDSSDGDNNRFDTLFGARRFDFGPTSQFGPFSRSNLTTPGLRLRLKPASTITSFVSLRSFWLADSNDTWITAGISNPAGSSDSYIATQVEVRARFNLIPQNLRIESGAAYLFAGDLMENAGKGDSSFIYTQIVLWF